MNIVPAIIDGGALGTRYASTAPMGVNFLLFQIVIASLLSNED